MGNEKHELRMAVLRTLGITLLVAGTVASSLVTLRTALPRALRSDGGAATNADASEAGLPPSR